VKNGAEEVLEVPVYGTVQARKEQPSEP
jgi:hypothetical protein